ncbi:hypothetical protein ACFY2W_34025 [Streptomyces sp. NPDC001262]|uniref:hypothetical protein n=1 Tax=Streptomyces sp. NPDC001262 TaxID=3364552 RepID=UPI003692959F
MLVEASPAYEAAGGGDEGVVEFEASFPADGEAFELVQEREGLLDEISELAQALDARGTFAGDDRQDAALAQFTAVGVAVVAFVASLGAVGTSADNVTVEVFNATLKRETSKGRSAGQGRVRPVSQCSGGSPATTPGGGIPRSIRSAQSSSESDQLR